MFPKQFESSCLFAERRIHAIERRMEGDPELKVQYHKFFRNYKGLDQREPMKSHGWKKHISVINHPVFKEISSPTRAWITMESNK